MSALRLRIVDSPDAARVGVEVPLDQESGLIGRSPSCWLSLEGDVQASRRHARIDAVGESFVLCDNSSANGVWLGDERVEEHRLKPGDVFRIGGTRFEVLGGVAAQAAEAPPPEPRSSEAPPPDAPPEEPHEEPSPEEPPHEEAEAPQSEPALPERPRPPGSGTVMMDASPLPPAEPSPRPGSGTVVMNASPPKPPAAPASPPPTSATQAIDGLSFSPESRPSGSPGTVMRQAAPLGAPSEVEAPERLSDLGEVVEVSGNAPFLIDDEDLVWIVEAGRVEVFTVVVKQRKPVGSRSHFASVEPGEALFGMDLHGYGLGSGFLAVGRVGTRLRRMRVSQLRRAAQQPALAGPVAELVDRWAHRLSSSLVAASEAAPRIDFALTPGEQAALEPQQRVRSAKGLLWLELRGDDVLFVGMESFPTDAARLFPVTPETWLECGEGARGRLEVRAHVPGTAVGSPGLWEGLARFHEILCRCEFVNKRLARVDQLNRLRSKAEHSRVAGDAAYRALRSVLVPDAPPAAEAAIDEQEGESLFRVVEQVASGLGIEARRPPQDARRTTPEEQLDAIARASRFRTRSVRLDDRWWTRQQGPLLVWSEEEATPLAAMPARRGYILFDPRTGSREAVAPSVAAGLSTFAVSFYRSLPEGRVGVGDLLRFGARDLKRDLWMLGLMAVALGLAGSLTPYFTGLVFDFAIPQAERGQLLQLGAGLVVAALASAAFSLTQSVASLRIQSSMEYSLQSAIWDRLLDLPSTFFRRFSAGDLSDRADAIDGIRDLVSGIGVSSLLGGFSSVFYLGVMLLYDRKLTLVAVGLTLLLIVFTLGANFARLRYERQLLEIRGQLTALVLQLISGVSKIRIAGAENHAFRVWAESFAKQKQLGVAIGRASNRSEVFNAGFPVLSSMAIFYVLYRAQQTSPAPGLTTGAFIAFSAAYGAFMRAAIEVATASLDLVRVGPIYRRLEPVLTTPPEVDSTLAHPGRLRGQIEISRVHFRYQADGAWILKDVSLEIEPGKFVAFVGPSGAGKSTLLRMLLGFEQPEKGSIYYDGQDLSTLDLREVRRQLGVVLQNSQVLPADIYRNIVGQSPRSIDDAWEAARMAGLADDLKAMPMGMHTYVSEGGTGLSGGQRQRLLIARALVNRPRILFMDEATSALDNRTQAVVTESLGSLQATRIVIAHRLSTIIDADRIYYMDDGQVVEQGSYAELMALDGRFAELARRQLA